MLKVGDKAPAFELPSDEGEMVSLSEFKGKTVVLYFYPKDLTPGCTQQACDFRDAIGTFTKKKAVILGVSRDGIEKHEKFREKNELNFPLLSDVDGSVCKAYGVWKEKSLYGKKYMGIERTTFVIGPDAKIKSIFEKVKINGHSEKVLEAVS